MSQAEFSVHLGGGLYMNSRGELSRGPEPGKPIYGTPGGGLPVNVDAFAKAFQGIAKALPDKDDPKSRQKLDKIFDGIGMTTANINNVIDVLQGIGAVASVIGSVVPIIGAVLAALTALLGIFKEGPSALELMIGRRFDELQRTIEALEVQIQQRDLRNQRSVISNALASAANYVAELKNSPPDEATLLLRRQDVRHQISLAATAVRNLLDSSTWLVSFDTNEHKWVWPWMAHRLYTVPATGAPLRATFLPQGANCFDHRLMVPLTGFGVTAFLTALRAVSPEFRSTRENREDMWDFAAALDVLVINMRREGLARTIYTAADFSDGALGSVPWGFEPGEVVDLSILGQPPRLAEGGTRFPVGALDLRLHNDSYFTPGFSAGRIQHSGWQYAKQGLLNVRWTPPARLEAYDVPVPSLGWEPANQPPRTQRRYRITNPDECAAAANAQAEQDFSDLLFSSGYLNLVHLLATLRHEATDPDRSQTVTTDAWLRRKPGAETAVLVESRPILLTGVVSAAAERQAQEYKATTWFTTQPLSRERKLNYRVWLRTLPMTPSLSGSAADAADEYRGYHRVTYTNDAAHPGCKQLVTSTGQALDGLKIADGGTSSQTREQEGTAVLTAHTYEYWIAVKLIDRPEILVEELTEASLRAVGWEAGASIHLAEASTGPTVTPQALPMLGGGQPSGFGSLAAAANLEIKYSDLIGWVIGSEPDKVRRRNLEEHEVRIDYKMRWQADRLTVSLANNREQDRNYVIYVVVEETLGSGTVLHTVERVPVTGQLTFVPQSFFDEEAEALAKTARFFRDFARRYAKSLGDLPRPGGPGDPDPGWLLGVDRHRLMADPVMQMLELSAPISDDTAERFYAMAVQHPPAAAVLRELLGEEALRPEDDAVGVFGVLADDADTTARNSR